MPESSQAGIRDVDLCFAKIRRQYRGKQNAIE